MKLVTPYTFWIRTQLGVENIAYQEIAENIPIKRYEIRNKSIFIEPENPEIDSVIFKKARTVDDVYSIIRTYRGIEKTKPSADAFVFDCIDDIISSAKKHKANLFFRATVSFVGKRNFSRFYIENQINEYIKNTTHMTPLYSEQGDTNRDGEFRVRIHIEDDIAFVGYALFETPLHRREWKVQTYDGQISSSVAAAMARTVYKEYPDANILDPFCGSGTLLIEHAIQSPLVNHMGFDISDTALTIAKNRIEFAKQKVSFIKKDAFLQTAEEIKNTIILSNPPWGEKHQIKEYAIYLDSLRTLLKKYRVAFLILPREIVEDLQEKGLSVFHIFETRIQGKVVLFVKIII